MSDSRFTGLFPRSGAAMLAVASIVAVALGTPQSIRATPDQIVVGQRERLGNRISLIVGPSTYAANTPFHVAHGWGLTPDDSESDAIGKWSFVLEIDGQALPANFVERSSNEDPAFGHLLSRFWVFNFPSGLSAGRHTFTGRWLGTCEVAVDGGLYAGPCTKPTEVVEVATRTLTVDFTRLNLAQGKAVAASSEYPGNPASLAVDGNWWTYWSSGSFPPAWIEVDLGATESVGEIKLGITQLPDCPTAHRIYGRAAGSDAYTLLQEFSGYTVDQQVLQFVPPAPYGLRFVKVETSSSCSWVGWREIEVFAATP